MESESNGEFEEMLKRAAFQFIALDV